MTKRELLKALEQIPDDMDVAVNWVYEQFNGDDPNITVEVRSPNSKDYDKDTFKNGETYVAIITH